MGKRPAGNVSVKADMLVVLIWGPSPRSVQQVSLDSSSLPVLLQRVDLYPVRAVIPKRPGREANLSGNTVPTVARDFVNSPIDLSLGVGCVVVTGLGADDVGELNSFGLECFGHHIGSLLLSVSLTAIGNRRAVEQIEGIIGAIIEMP